MDTQFTEMGNRIRQRRNELNIKQASLAESLNISNNHMSSIERGKEKPSMDTFVRICEELKVTPDYLLLGSMHANDIPQNIIDNLRLCSQEDIILASEIIKLFVRKNHQHWNADNFI